MGEAELLDERREDLEAKDPLHGEHVALLIEGDVFGVVVDARTCELDVGKYLLDYLLEALLELLLDLLLGDLVVNELLPDVAITSDALLELIA